MFRFIYIISSLPATGNPPPPMLYSPGNHPTTPRHLQRSVTISYAILTCWPRATYDLCSTYRIPPFAVFITAYMHIQSIYSVSLPVQYSTCLVSLMAYTNCYQDLLCYTLYIQDSSVPPIHYVHDTSIAPHPSRRGGRL